jgi:hypothetical protein
MKVLIWCFVGMIVGTYLFKEVGVDVIQTTIDCLNSVFTYIQAHASK